jgi:hypothetical protein
MGRPERACKKNRSAWGTGWLRFFMRIAVKAFVAVSAVEKIAESELDDRPAHQPLLFLGFLKITKC